MTRYTIQLIACCLLMLAALSGVQAGDGTAANEQGRLYLQVGLDQLAVEKFREAAEAGNAYGQANLGWAYAKGLGKLDTDLVQASGWYRKAADQGLAYAQARLARFYFYGWGVTRSRSEAAKLARLAADQEDAEGQAFLAYLYTKGYGVKKNLVRALELNTASATQGYAEGQVGLGWQYHKGLGVALDQKRAIYWFERAAKQNHSRGINNLAWILATTTDPALRDGKRAVELLEDLVFDRKLKRPGVYDSLAAAYAEVGRFDDAVSMQLQALELLKKRKDKKMLARFQQHLQYYQQEKPWRQK